MSSAGKHLEAESRFSDFQLLSEGCFLSCQEALELQIRE